MSSIISDIFYNQNNSLLDNYLINRQQTPTSQPSPPPSPPPSPSLPSPLLLLTFTLTPIKTKSSNILEIVLKMGKYISTETIYPENCGNKVNVKMIIPQQSVYTHQLVSIQFHQFVQGKGMKEIGHGFLPCRNLGDMCTREITNKQFNVKFVQNYNRYTNDRQNRHNKLNRQSKKMNSIESIDVQVKIQKIQDHDSRDGINQNLNFHKNYHNLKKFDSEERKNLNYEKFGENSLDSKINSQVQWQNNAINVPPIEFWIKEVILENNANSKTKGSLFKITQTLSEKWKFQDENEEIQINFEEKNWKIGEFVKIGSQNLTPKGITLKVLNKGEQIGHFHLNSLILFGGSIQGNFPINDIQERYIGTIKLSAFEEQIENQNKRIDSFLPVSSYCDVLDSKGEEKQMESGVLLQIPIILILTNKSKCNQSSKVKLLIRQGNQIKVAKLQHKNTSYVWQISVTEDIFLNSCRDPVELQLYNQNQLLGYYKLPITPKEGIEINSTLINFGLQGSIVQGILNWASYTLESSPILLPKLLSHILKGNIHTPTEVSPKPLEALFPQHPLSLLKSLVSAYPLMNIEKYPLFHQYVEIQDKIKEKLVKEVGYLDGAREGVIGKGEMKEVMGFYGVQGELGEEGKEGGGEGVLYLFAIAGVKVGKLVQVKDQANDIQN